MFKKIHLKNFRSWREFSCEFGHITIFVGPNGAGKTNIIEAVRFLSVLKSFRAREQKELVRWGAAAARVIGVFNGDTIEVGLAPGEKAVKVNGVGKAPSQIVGRLKTVVFSPDDMALLTGPPSGRRRFLDGVLVQKDRQYLAGLATYQNVVRRRNALLEAIAFNRAVIGDLAVWDDKLVELAWQISGARKKFMAFLAEQLSGLYRLACADKAVVGLAPKWSELSLERLAAHLNRDIQLRATTIGPHHDDFSVLLNDRDVGRFGSRGENRTAIVVLKIIELEYLKNDDSAPVLLLDDIFSELDHSRRARLQDLIKDYQTIITTTDEHYIGDGLKKRAKIIKL